MQRAGVACAHVRMRAQVKSLPIHKDDEVQIVRGKFAKEQGGKVTTVYRRRYCVHIDRIVKEKANGAQVPPLPLPTPLPLPPDRPVQGGSGAGYHNSPSVLTFVGRSFSTGWGGFQGPGRMTPREHFRPRGCGVGAFSSTPRRLDGWSKRAGTVSNYAWVWALD